MYCAYARPGALQRIDLDGFASGIYVVYTVVGSKVYASKIVK